MSNIKPIDADIRLKYICPSTECNAEHWLSIKEAKVQDFKVLCDVCDTVFTPKRVKSITVNFLEEIQEPEKQDNIKNISEVQREVLKCLGML